MTDMPVLIHACPPEGSGIMPCCGRTPFEVTSHRMTQDREKVTCRGYLGVLLPEGAVIEYVDGVTEGAEPQLVTGRLFDGRVREFQYLHDGTPAHGIDIAELVAADRIRAVYTQMGPR